MILGSINSFWERLWEISTIEILRVTSEWAWPAFLHGKRLKTARYSEAKEGTRQQTSAALVIYGRPHFPSVATLKKELFIQQQFGGY